MSSLKAVILTLTVLVAVWSSALASKRCALKMANIDQVFGSGVDVVFDCHDDVQGREVEVERASVFILDSEGNTVCEAIRTKSPYQCRGLKYGTKYTAKVRGQSNTLRIEFTTPGDCLVSNVRVDCLERKVRFSCAKGSQALLQIWDPDTMSTDVLISESPATYTAALGSRKTVIVKGVDQTDLTALFSTECESGERLRGAQARSRLLSHRMVAGPQ